jgi:molybdopterin synthase catalytic subunit
MSLFRLTEQPILGEELRSELRSPRAGGFVAFEGWVRDHQAGRRVIRLEYQAYSDLAIKEGERILVECVERNGLLDARCVHRVGMLEVGELAVWIGVSSAHRDEAFAACRAIIDRIKTRVPIWKKEYYADGESEWINCESCAPDAEFENRT